MPRSETISVYLLKDSVHTATDALKDGAEYSQHAVDAPPTEGTLFVKATTDREPDWVRLLAPVTTPAVDERGRSTGAILVLHAGGRWFAIAFGTGYHLLDEARYERGFGRRVALNAVDPDRLRGAQTRTFNDYALHSSLQLSRVSDVTALEVDFQRDLLTSIAGSIADAGVGQRIDGTNAARLTAKIDVSELAPKCEVLLALSEDNSYRTVFPRVDTIREIQDPDAIAALEKEMLDAFGGRRFDEFDLFPPELVPDEIVRYRTYPRHDGLVVVEPDSSLLKYPRDRYGAEHERALDRYKLIGCDSSDDEVKRWTFRECLRYQVRRDGYVAVLDGGLWYRVQQHLVEDVEAFVDELESSGLALPAAALDQKEGEYNASAAEQDGLALLDTKLVGIGGGRVEPCDLLSDRRHLVHVKRRKGGSAPLSHLYYQAMVSAESLMDGGDFADQIRDKLSSDPPQFADQFNGGFDAREWKVVLALITRSQTAGDAARALPFFSKVALRIAVQHLRRMGFQVYVDEIPTPLR